MSSVFRRQPTGRLTSNHFVRNSGTDASKLIADGFWEPAAAQGGIVTAAAVVAGTGAATGAGSAAIKAEAAVSIQGAASAAGRGAANVSAAAASQGSAIATGRSTAIVQAALSAAGVATAAFSGALVTNANSAFSISGSAASAFEGEADYNGEGFEQGPPELESHKVCVGGACGGQAPTMQRRSRKRGEPKVIQTIKVGHWPTEAELRVKPVDSTSIFCITCEDT